MIGPTPAAGVSDTKRSAPHSSPPAAPVATKSWPTVRGKMFTGCLRQLQHEPLSFYRGVWREHGDFVRIRAVPGIYFFLLAHPDAVEYVLHGNLKNYRKPDSFNHSVSLLAGNGILTSEGELWRKQRRLMQPAFLRNSRGLDRRAHGRVASGSSSTSGTPPTDGRTLDVLPEMMRLGLRIASTTLLGTDISGDADAIGQAYRTAFEYVSLKMNGRLMFQPLWLPTARNREFRRAKALLDRVVLELIAQRRREAAANDVLGRLLAAQDEDSGRRHDRRATQGRSDHASDRRPRNGRRGAVLGLVPAGSAPRRAASNCTTRCAGICGGRLADGGRFAADAAGHGRVRGDRCGSIRRPGACRAKRSPPTSICGYPMPAKATIVLSQLLDPSAPGFLDRARRVRSDSVPAGEATHAGRSSRSSPSAAGRGFALATTWPWSKDRWPWRRWCSDSTSRWCRISGSSPIPTFTLRPKYGVQLVVRKRT